MGKKRIVLSSAAIVLTVVLVLVLITVILCRLSFSRFYTEEEHLARISELVDKHYMTKDSGYTSFEVFPLYNEYDEFEFAVVEFEPRGYIYVMIRKQTVPLIGTSLYLKDADENRFWRPVVYKEGAICTIINENGEMEIYRNACVKKDENGNYLGFEVSHFKAAQIENEKRYLLALKDNAGSFRGYIPAVKRGDKILNLASFEEMEYFPEMRSETCTVSNVGFIAKKYFDL